MSQVNSIYIGSIESRQHEERNKHIIEKVDGIF